MNYSPDSYKKERVSKTVAKDLLLATRSLPGMRQKQERERKKEGDAESTMTKTREEESGGS
jgi:hypothetical protein